MFVVIFYNYSNKCLLENACAVIICIKNMLLYFLQEYAACACNKQSLGSTGGLPYNHGQMVITLFILDSMHKS